MNYNLDLVSLSNALNYDKHPTEEVNYINIACKLFKLNKKELLGFKRSDEYKHTRAILANHLYNNTKRTLQDVGDSLERTHVGVINLIKDYNKQDKELIEMVERFNHELNR